MKLATLKIDGHELLHLLAGDAFLPVAELGAALGRHWPGEFLPLLASGSYHGMLDWYRDGGAATLATLPVTRIARERAVFAPLYRHPRKIWGIGLNYRDHAADLAERSPTAEPASFMKPDTAIIGHGDTILLPRLSQRTTGEAELGLIFGRRCRDVSRADWRDALAGFTTIIDMTAEDILRRNPRNLTQSKSFDTFFSFGPLFHSTDEVDDVLALEVRTVHNGAVHARNVVRNMTFPPDQLVSYHSQIMTMLPGDILSSGTPGAVALADGDVIACHIDGFEPLVNPVRDLKLT
jgi:2-keto-4-pentenoate hydratase/2-oxohepta-3-ene-1,7-dioic acid hydratase in catechol pathway